MDTNSANSQENVTRFPIRRVKHAGGRPTKYKRKYATDILDYFDIDVVHKIVDPNGKGGKTTHFETVRVPSIIGFAASIGVHKDTLYEWAKAKHPQDHEKAGQLKHPEFSDSFTRAQEIEQALIFEYGMAGRLDRSLAAMYFTNKLGFTNTQNIDHTTKGKALPTPILGGSTPLLPMADKEDEDEDEGGLSVTIA